MKINFGSKPFAAYCISRSLGTVSNPAYTLYLPFLKH